VTGTNDPRAARRAAEQAARTSYGRLVSILAARDRDIATAEDALSAALVAALQTWPETGVPENPEAWLVTAARNRQRNEARARALRRAAEPEVARRIDWPQDGTDMGDRRLELMFLCTHPAIDPAARAPLILQAVLGIDAATISRAFLVEPAAMSQRLVRAKARIRDAGLRFAPPDPADLPDRLAAVLDAIYAAFGRGWDILDTPDTPEALSGEAIWLARLVAAQLPQEPEPKGLLALMLYCTARHRARRDAEGRFVPLDRQDVRLWDRNRIIEAEGLLTAAARAGRFGRYQCEAAIQSVHVQRPVTGRLNHAALRTLYDLLVAQSDSIAARIGRAVLLAETGEIETAIRELDALPADRIERHQPWWVARSRVAQLAGQPKDAARALDIAIALTTDDAVRRFLSDQRAGHPAR
jgi:RNA polymerase sigma-70 factor (ECF subfamily)